MRSKIEGYKVHLHYLEKNILMINDYQGCKVKNNLICLNCNKSFMATYDKLKNGKTRCSHCYSKNKKKELKKLKTY